MRYIFQFLIILTLISFTSCSNKSYIAKDNSIIINNNDGLSMRLTPYGKKMIRVQYALQNDSFFEDNHYEMVASHDVDEKLEIVENDTHYSIVIEGQSDLKIIVNKQYLTIEYQYLNQSLLEGMRQFSATKNNLNIAFKHDESEHFTGLGHSYFGRSESIDLKGEKHTRNYGSDESEQAPLIVPFYMSSKGYGIFLNSTFENYFNFGKDNTYEFGIETNGFKGQMDYFFILGPELKEVLKEYVTLTGKPRLPQKSIFGLQLSDKGHDHNSKTPSDEQWWKNKVNAHKAAGYPIDHLVNDNRWRAGGGKRCESFIEWDKGRYPNPENYQSWLENQHLTMTLDFNRCIGQFSEGWKSEFNIPVTDAINFGESAPDLTNLEFRKWFWDVFYEKSLNPELNYPGDALWIDEFDEMGNAPKDMILANGKSSAEMRNYWFFLIAKALVKDGWDKQIGEQKRPFVWVRGMTAGAQRYASLWSGDIKPDYKDMKLQIRGMQLAGLSGFPFWGHDAGGFYDWDKNVGPNEQLYQQWSMGMGIFSPIWKPHGMGASRWPIDRSSLSQNVAKKYSDLRYQLMPYTYSNAFEAHDTGMPMVRAMLLEYSNNENAWTYDLQYLWGKDMLIAPNITTEPVVDLWLPKGGWYNFWTDKFHPNEEIMSYQIENNEYPVFVKAGAIIPMVEPADNMANLQLDNLVLHVYSGANGNFTLYEDDGVTEKFRTNSEHRKTVLNYNHQTKQVVIDASKGTFLNANSKRHITLIMHGVSEVSQVKVNNNVLNESNFNYQENNILSIKIDAISVDTKTIIQLID